jgi:hypothetical protein
MAFGWVEDKLESVAATVALEAERTRDALSAGLAETQRGMRVDGAAYRPLPPAGGVVYGGARRLVGWSVRETGGTNAASVDLYDGGDAGAIDPTRLVGTFTVPAGGSIVAHQMPAGIAFVQGLFAVITGTGVLRGALWIGAVD